jgi:alpha-galactosidase
LKVGIWTAPFEVAERAWIYEHHKDWLLHNAHGDPISIGEAEEMEGERLFVLDVTHPDAQEYLRQTYRTLVREWGVRYIKLDFMDNTAIEGYYHRPNTTALEAQRIGLEIIRKAVGEDVLLDKDGSPMLNPVGLVDEGGYPRIPVMHFSAVRRLSRASRHVITCIATFSSRTRMRSRFPGSSLKNVPFKLHSH